MDHLWQAFLKALELLYTFDSEVMQIAGRTLYIGLSSTVIASIICIPLGAVIHFNQFWGKRLLINLIQTFYSTPTVVIGLFVLIMLSRAGPLGILEILFTAPPKSLKLKKPSKGHITFITHRSDPRVLDNTQTSPIL